ncbi:sporulation-control protein [Catenuloplanes nepalensis]|uniref:Sporulation-control protein n=1 Tax=Catenuloplanes nepalensis TaxID=587533 RepID=A0ABT9N180_9ACTN|nr:sporulation protein [Catenuloplanes nepalensis]MDP9797031.1 sporulation-control protein [Catenuloplanes nepalensis]
MVFKKMLSALGVGGPSVDTVLANPNTRPGLTLDGQVNIVGGTTAVDIEHVALGLVTRVEVEGHDTDWDSVMEFHRVVVAGRFRLEANERRQLPVRFPIPWETPITDVYGQRLRGMTMGLRTELSVARAVDKGDLDPIYVHPLPIQEKILDAFMRLGFHFKTADLERGRITGVNQQLPFYQEIEFYPPAQYQGTINEVELTFVTNPQGMDIVLEFDKRGGFFTEGRDTYGRYQVSHAQADDTDWAQVVDGWMRQAVGGYSSMRSSHGGGYGAPGYGAPGHGAPGYGAPGGYPPPGYPAPGGGYGAPGHGAPGYGHGGGYHGHYRRGHGGGMGGVVAGAAGGLLGGMILGEAVEDVFEGDEGDEG